MILRGVPGVEELGARLSALGARLRRSRLLAGFVLGSALLGLCLLGAMGFGVARTPFPEALRKGPPPPSVRVLDRGGRLLAEVTTQGEHVGGVRLEELPDHVIQAVLAAEDSRFYSHPGVDPVALLRASLQALAHGRLVSGASTITQQLARSTFDRPRTWRGKWREMLIALRIERELDKGEILEAYLNRIDFAPRVRGLDAASRVFFDKPAARLGLAEAALLVGLPRGPSFYDPNRGTERAQRRRDTILERLRDSGVIDKATFERARLEPVVLRRALPTRRAEHFTRALARGRFTPDLPPGNLREVVSTLDHALQAEVEGLARATLERLRKNDATAASVLVVDNRTREVLAYLGAPDFWSTENQGQNDGVRALRQPGSTLKPFVYATAVESLGYTSATVLPDVELHFPTPRGDYSPRNYDGQFHGPVRLRQALASSLNVPAVFTAAQTGPDRVLELLRRVGFDSLQANAGEYGVALALGDGEVTLLELAAAYATLAQGGTYQPLGFVRSARTLEQPSYTPPPRPTRRALAPELARLVTDWLSDDAEREAGFGRDNVLEFPFDVAVKTGTSKGYRDNWTVGFSSEVTVAVWVGNFDARPMLRSSGVTGAGPLFHDVMIAAMRSRAAAPLELDGDFPALEICPLSGARRGPHCPASTRERFLPGHVPGETCAWHEVVSVLPDTGLLAGPGCPGAVERVFERYPPSYEGWAERAHRPLAPTRFDPRCPGELAHAARLPTVSYPFHGARFARDPALSAEQQRLVFRAHAPRGQTLWFRLDGARLGRANENFELAWPLAPGAHVLAAESQEGVGPSVRFVVD